MLVRDTPLVGREMRIDFVYFPPPLEGVPLTTPQQALIIPVAEAAAAPTTTPTPTNATDTTKSGGGSSSSRGTGSGGGAGEPQPVGGRVCSGTDHGVGSHPLSAPGAAALL